MSSSKSTLYRALEILPGTLTWLTFILPFFFSFYYPEIVAIFIIFFTLNWLFRSTLLALDLVRGYWKVRTASRINWLRRCQKFDKGKTNLTLEEKYNLELIHRRDNEIQFSDLTHVIILVTYKEPLALLRQSIDSYITSSFPVKEKLIFVLAGEQRDPTFPATARTLQTEYSTKFRDFLITTHPKDLPNEVIGKSANTTWAAKQFKKYVDEKGLNPPHILLHNFDADTLVHPQYFAEISYRYLLTPDRTTVAFQPFHFYHNNIWAVPVFVRMLAISCSFWKVAESQRQDKFRSFSSRSNPFQMILDVNYWDPSVIPEDSRQYWTAYLRYRGHHPVIPLYSPLYLDAVQDTNYWRTIRAQYAQLRRWSWGITDFPWLVHKFWADRQIPIHSKLYQLYDLLIGHWYWATAPFLLTFLGSLPGLLNPSYNQTILAARTPEVISLILTLSSIGILACIGISFALIPRPQRTHHRLLAYLSLIFQWILIPIVSLIFSAIPAIHSQTNLMRGKYLEYRVTPKTR